jgi:hypothetical protein
MIRAAVIITCSSRKNIKNLHSGWLNIYNIVVNTLINERLRETTLAITSPTIYLIRPVNMWIFFGDKTVGIIISLLYFIIYHRKYTIISRISFIFISFWTSTRSSFKETHKEALLISSSNKTCKLSRSSSLRAPLFCYLLC